MASIQSVKALVFRLNHITYCDQPREMYIPCEESEPQGIEYWNPYICNGVMNCYTPTTDPNKAQADSIKTVRIRNHADNNTYWIVVDSANGENVFTDACNGCCGTTPDLTTGIVIPTPVVEAGGTVDPATGNSKWTFPVPYDGTTNLQIGITTLTYNSGQKPATPPAAGFGTIGALVTWLNANASAMGVWTQNSLTNIGLAGASGVSTVGASFELLPAKRCLDLPATAFTADELILMNLDGSGNDIHIKIPPTVISDANHQGVLDMLKANLPIGTLTMSNVGADYKIQYEGTMLPFTIQNSTGQFATFASGAC